MTESISRKQLNIFVGLIVVIGLALRLLAAQTEFWLDEVWSWQFARSISNPMQILTAIHHDNNHYLNTLWMYVIGDQTNWLLYRIPALLSGTAVIAATAMVARQRGALQVASVAVLSAFCFLLILSSSEARGQIVAALFVVLCVDQVDRYVQTQKLVNAILFIVFAGLAWSAHLSCFIAFCGIVPWSIAAAYMHERKLKQCLKTILILHAPVALWLFILWDLDVASIARGGAPQMSVWETLYATSSLFMGFPIVPFLSGICTLFLVVLTVCGLIRLLFLKSSRFLLYFGAIVLGPVLFVLVSHSEDLYPRHFIVCVPILCLLFSEMFGMFAKRTAATVAVCFGLLIYALHGTARTVAFAHEGRGHYLEALTYMLTEKHQITVGATYDFQLRKLMWYYGRLLPADAKFSFVPSSLWAEHPPEWIIVALSEYRDPSGTFIGLKRSFVMKDLVKFGGHDYKLDKVFPYSGDLTGSHWLLYRRAAEAGGL